MSKEYSKNGNDHSGVTPEIIALAFERRAKDIESLRLYDLGEKEINVPDLKSP
jgi:hypothetical protein